MMMRSFRLSPETFEDLTRIAEWRAARDHKPVNLTTSLAWAVSQGVEGIAKIERQAEALPDDVREQLFKVAKVTEALAQQWLWIARSADVHATHGKDLAAENAALRDRVRELGAELERAKAIPYVPPAA